jgi:hypothetical protein
MTTWSGLSKGAADRSKVSESCHCGDFTPIGARLPDKPDRREPEGIALSLVVKGERQ